MINLLSSLGCGIATVFITTFVIHSIGYSNVGSGDAATDFIAAIPLIAGIVVMNCVGAAVNNKRGKQ